MSLVLVIMFSGHSEEKQRKEDQPVACIRGSVAPWPSSSATDARGYGVCTPPTTCRSTPIAAESKTSAPRSGNSPDPMRSTPVHNAQRNEDRRKTEHRQSIP